MYIDSSEAEVAPAAHDLSAAWAQIAAIVAAVDATLGKWLTDNYGIGLTEYRAALHLSRSSDHELRINDLAHSVGLNQSSATRLVGRMEDKGLAFRDTCPEDGRRVYAVIADKGLSSAEEIREPYEEKIRELLKGAAEQYPNLNLAGLDYSFKTISELTA